MFGTHISRCSAVPCSGDQTASAGTGATNMTTQYWITYPARLGGGEGVSVGVDLLPVLWYGLMYLSGMGNVGPLASSNCAPIF